MKYYLAGPMSGIKQFNIPAFDLATELLRINLYNVTSPCELDGPEYRAAAMGSETGIHEDAAGLASWGDMLARDVKLITDEMDALIMMDGWSQSNGARLEAYVGVLAKKKFYLYQGNGTILKVSLKSIAEILSNALTSN